MPHGPGPICGYGDGRITARVEQAAATRERAEWNFARSILDAAPAGFSDREIAERAGVSRSRIGQIIGGTK